MSGLPFRIPLIDYAPRWASLAYGGGFGPEGGLVATVAICLATLAAWRWTPIGAGVRVGVIGAGDNGGTASLRCLPEPGTRSPWWTSPADALEKGVGEHPYQPWRGW